MFCKNEHEWRFATGISERIVDNNWLSNPATLHCTLQIITITINNNKIRIKYSFWIRIAIFLETFDTIWKGCIELNSCNTENKNYCRRPHLQCSEKCGGDEDRSSDPSTWGCRGCNWSLEEAHDRFYYDLIGAIICHYWVTQQLTGRPQSKQTQVWLKARSRDCRALCGTPPHPAGE